MSSIDSRLIDTYRLRLRLRLRFRLRLRLRQLYFSIAAGLYVMGLWGKERRLLRGRGLVHRFPVFGRCFR